MFAVYEHIGNPLASFKRPLFMKRTLVPVLLAAAAFSCADVTPFTINVNYAWSNSFDLNGGGSGRLQGLELAVSQSLLKLPMLGEARVGVSALFGNVLSRGGEDGTLYRIFAYYKTPMAGPSGVYGLGGLSYASATGRNGNFDTQSGLGLDFGFGFPIGTGVPGVPGAAIEVMYHQGAKAATRGFSVGLNVHF